MSKSNLPPGVTTSMLPGNTSEDTAWEKFCEWACDEYAKSEHSLDIEESYMAVRAGISAIKAIRKDMLMRFKEIRADERMAYEMERNQEDEERERKAAFNSECG